MTYKEKKQELVDLIEETTYRAEQLKDICLKLKQFCHKKLDEEDKIKISKDKIIQSKLDKMKDILTELGG